MSELFKLNEIIDIKEFKGERRGAPLYKKIKMLYSPDTSFNIYFMGENLFCEKNTALIMEGKEEYYIRPVLEKEIKLFIIDCEGYGMESILNQPLKIQGMSEFLLENSEYEFKNYKMDVHSDEAGRQQMAENLMVQFMILMYRRVKNIMRNVENNSGINIVEKVTDYLHENISNEISLPDVVKYANMSATALKKVFKENMGIGVMKYFNLIKIEKAKMLLSEGQYNVSQIAMILGYESIHYFSKQFKTFVGVSPTYYISNIKNNSWRNIAVGISLNKESVFMRLIIDRIENEYAVVELPDKSFINLPKKIFGNAKEGDVFEIEKNNDEKNKRKDNVEKLMNKLFE